MLVKIVWQPHRLLSKRTGRERVIPRSAKRIYRRLFAGIALLLAISLVGVKGWTWWSAKKELWQANALIDAARYSEAVQVLTESIRWNPSMKLYRLRAVAYGKLGDEARQMADLETVISQEPGDGWAYRFRAEIFTKHLDYSAAVDDLNNALRLSPNWIEGYSIRGETYKKMGQLADALDDLNMAVALQPLPENYYKRGVVLALRRDYRKAIADFTIALSLNSHLADVYRARANALEGIGDTEAAQADLERAASAAP
ncbi:MAG TPA: hypothetical protein VMT15_19730 [Bryobacteraceae bacterium]|nr:hypothetical protein [Bryobacteraceae bacterium]